MSDPPDRVKRFLEQRKRAEEGTWSPPPGYEATSPTKLPPVTSHGGPLPASDEPRILWNQPNKAHRPPQRSAIAKRRSTANRPLALMGVAAVMVGVVALAASPPMGFILLVFGFMMVFAAQLVNLDSRRHDSPDPWEINATIPPTGLSEPQPFDPSRTELLVIDDDQPAKVDATPIQNTPTTLPEPVWQGNPAPIEETTSSTPDADGTTVQVELTPENLRLIGEWRSATSIAMSMMFVLGAICVATAIVSLIGLGRTNLTPQMHAQLAAAFVSTLVFAIIYNMIGILALSRSNLCGYALITLGVFGIVSASIHFVYLVIAGGSSPAPIVTMVFAIMFVGGGQHLASLASQMKRAGIPLTLRHSRVRGWTLD